MKDRPILFSGPMVRALLDGSKTQTRRVVKQQPPANAHQVETWHHPDSRPRYFTWTTTGEISDAWEPVPCPYGQPGDDRLWVREAWRIGAWQEDDGKVAIDYLASEPTKTPWIKVPENADDYHGGSLFEKYWMQSTDDCIKAGLYLSENDRYNWAPGESPCRIRPSIHMPRWASRITLEITGVRVERLQDISEADALAEGVNVHPDHHGKSRTSIYSPVQAYRDLWESINGPGSWDANPWVWVVEFQRIEGGATCP